MDMKNSIKNSFDGTIKEQINHLSGAYKYSLSGVRYCLKETAVWQELCLGIVVLPLVVFLPLTLSIRLLLFSLWLAMLVVEALNTAIEAVVDLVSPEFHELAKKAKDCGSAALFLMIILNGIVWICVLTKVILDYCGVNFVWLNN